MAPSEYSIRMLSRVKASRCRLQVSVIGTRGPLTRHINSTSSPTVTTLLRLFRDNFTKESVTQIHNSQHWQVRKQKLVIIQSSCDHEWSQQKRDVSKGNLQNTVCLLTQLFLTRTHHFSISFPSLKQVKVNMPITIYISIYRISLYISRSLSLSLSRSLYI